jgi:ketosteroid isomerase-like protein
MTSRSASGTNPVRWGAVLVLALGACASVQPRPAHDEAADRAAITAADIAFDRETFEKGIDGWISWFEPQTTSWVKMELVHGRELYRTTMGPLLAKEGTHLRWQPLWAEVSGDLGYTTGRWQFHQPKKDGPEAGKDEVVQQGRYVTVWRRQADGSWRAAFDLGNDDK